MMKDRWLQVIGLVFLSGVMFMGGYSLRTGHEGYTPPVVLRDTVYVTDTTPNDPPCYHWVDQYEYIIPLTRDMVKQCGWWDFSKNQLKDSVYSQEKELECLTKRNAFFD